MPNKPLNPTPESNAALPESAGAARVSGSVELSRFAAASFCRR